MTANPEKMFQPTTTPPAENSGRSTAERLRQSAEQLKQMPDHGSSLGVTEMMTVAEDYPDLIGFFENGQEGLDLSAAERLAELQEKFLLGKINKEEFAELKKFFNGYQNQRQDHKDLGT